MIVMKNFEPLLVVCVLLTAASTTFTTCTAAAFVPSRPPLLTTKRTKSSTFSLASTGNGATSTSAEKDESPATTTPSRRDVLKQSLVALTAASVATAVPMGSNSNNMAAHATEIDYGKVQDLLGNTATLSPEAYSTKRPTYLTEPTEEFKANEVKSADFKRTQLAQKKQFQTVLDKLQNDPNEADLLEADLDNLRKLVSAGEGLPLGITKQDIITQVRRRKAKKFWPTKVEIAYQELVSEINYQQSPNTEKNSENPF